MFALRRCAARALTQQSKRQLSNIRPTTRVKTEIIQPTLLRNLHQSRLWLAQEGAGRDEASPADVEVTDETVTTEPSASEKSLKASIKEPATIAEQAKQYASSAAETVSNAARSTANAATSFVSWPGNDYDSSEKRILYVGNLSFDTTESEVKAEFSPFGEIIKMRLVTDLQGVSKGFAFIEFADTDSAERALNESDQKALNDRRMAVQFHTRRERRPSSRPQGPVNPPSKTLFIGNMSYQMSDKDLNELFREIRNVLDVRVAIDRRTGQPRGFAHADFVDVDSAVRAREILGEKTVFGRQLRIDYSARSEERSGRSGGDAFERRDERGDRGSRNSGRSGPFNDRY